MANLAQSFSNQGFQPITIGAESSVLPPINALRLTRNNAHYVSYEPYENQILERSISSSPTFVWPTGTVTFHPLRSH